MLTLIYIIGFLFMTAKTSHDTGRDYPKTVFGFSEIFAALGSGAAWPLWLLTIIPHEAGVRKTEVRLEQARERAALESEGRSEVERLLAPAKPAPAETVTISGPPVPDYLDPTHPDNVGHPLTCGWFDCGLCRHEASERNPIAKPPGHAEICICKRCRQTLPSAYMYEGS